MSRTIVFVALLLVSPMRVTYAQQVTVLTLRALEPIIVGQENRVSIVYLDDVSNIEGRLDSLIVGNDHERSVKLIQKNLTKHDQKALAYSWQGIAQAQKLQLEYLPAILINEGEYVYYGYDVNYAMDAHAHFLATQ